VERICRIKQAVPKKAQLSFACSDLSHLSDFTKPFSNSTYRLLKEYLPSPTLGRPILSAALPGEMLEDYTDPEIMFENFRNDDDFVVDGGIGGLVPSTVIDCRGDEPVQIREGLGEWEK